MVGFNYNINPYSMGVRLSKHGCMVTIDRHQSERYIYRAVVEGYKTWHERDSREYGLNRLRKLWSPLWPVQSITLYKTICSKADYRRLGIYTCKTGLGNCRRKTLSV